MPLAIICSAGDLDAQLQGTPLWRADVERHRATSAQEAELLALAARPTVVVIDRDLPGAEKLIVGLRQEPATRATSIAVVAGGDLDPLDLALLEAGANAVFRLPATTEWDERLSTLLDVPTRRQARFPVQFELDAFRPGPHQFPAQALNLSQSGMLLEADALLSPGDDLELQFRPTEKDPAIRTRARVIRQAAPARFGVQFGGLAAADRERIRRFVESAPAP